MLGHTRIPSNIPETGSSPDLLVRKLFDSRRLEGEKWCQGRIHHRDCPGKKTETGQPTFQDRLSRSVVMRK
jgi:hypothetical protein